MEPTMSEKLAALSAKITADLIGMMAKHDVSENVRPWAPASPDQGSPYNVMTGKAYRGMNPIILNMEGRSVGGWATCLQWNELGARIKAGEHGTGVIKWVDLKDNAEKVSSQPNRVVPNRMIPVPFTLFNVEQVSGAPPLITPPITWDPHERAEALIEASGAYIEHRNSDAAFYSQGADKIVMPLRSQFASAEEWAAVMCHELGHWTGHPSRLHRDFGGFQSPERAREELRAELSAAFTCAELGLATPKMDVQHAVYLKSWVTLLQNDPKELLRAAADAQRMSTMVLSFDRYKQLSEERDQARSLAHLVVKKEAKQSVSRSSKYKSKTPSKSHEQQGMSP
jgi:putative DNA primase/helicase